MSLVPNEGQKSMFPMIDELRKEVERLQKENDELRQQLKKCNLQNVSNCALPPLTEFATKALDNIADACRYITSGNASHQSKAIEGSAKRNAEFIRKHYC